MDVEACQGLFQVVQDIGGMKVSVFFMYRNGLDMEVDSRFENGKAIHHDLFIEEQLSPGGEGEIDLRDPDGEIQVRVGCIGGIQDSFFEPDGFMLE